ncbi:MAG: M48 family metallopeptidase [Selenomonadaceae bacterium]|nr:M48 family metallopeptidase [Selenomonadaceae bacterium]
MISYKLIRANRKSVSMRIETDGSVVVRAPKSIAKSEIDKMVKKQEGWIREKLAEIKNFEAAHPSNSITYLGKTYLMVEDDIKEAVIKADKIFIPRNFDLIYWLQCEAARILTERIKRYAMATHLIPSRTKLSDAATRWGSCSTRKSINLSWRLIFCPMSVIDYVVVHELCHIAHMNHSAAFWQKVESVLPEYKKERAWLKENARLLDMYR